MGCLTASGRNAPAAANKVWRRGGQVAPFFCHSRAGGNRDQAVRVKRAKKSESVCVILICDIAKIILPLTTHTKKIFKDPIPAYAGMTKGAGFILLMSSCGLTTGPRYICVPCAHTNEK